jgi:hypothetical protein
VSDSYSALHFVAVEPGHAEDADREPSPMGKLLLSHLKPEWTSDDQQRRLGAVRINAPLPAPPPLPLLVSFKSKTRSLYVLQQVPQEFQERASFQQRGFYRAAGLLREQLSGASSAELWWAAVELALKGQLRLPEVRRWSPALAAILETPSPALVQVEGTVLSAARMEQLISELPRTATERSGRNPLLIHVDLLHVMEWLQLGSVAVARVVQQRWAAVAEAPLTDSVFGPAVPVEATPESAADTAAIAAILAVFEAEAGLPRSTLNSRFPSSRHVIEWLFESHRLIESPGGFIFTGDELATAADAFAAKGQLDVPGTGEIKRVLGLQRRKAEELRALLSYLDERGQLALLSEGGNG